MRLAAIEKAKTAKRVGLLLSSLGRQASVGLAEDIFKLLQHASILPVPIVMGEFAPNKLKQLTKHVDACVQVRQHFRV